MTKATRMQKRGGLDAKARSRHPAGTVFVCHGTGSAWLIPFPRARYRLPIRPVSGAPVSRQGERLQHQDMNNAQTQFGGPAPPAEGTGGAANRLNQSQLQA